MMDIIQKFIHLQIKEEKKRLPDDTEQVTKKKTLIFPRYHQLDVVRKLIADVREEGSGHNYLIQHSAGSGNQIRLPGQHIDWHPCMMPMIYLFSAVLL